jgi:hypothetical protein
MDIHLQEANQNEYLLSTPRAKNHVLARFLNNRNALIEFVFKPDQIITLNDKPVRKNRVSDEPKTKENHVSDNAFDKED